MLHMCWALVTFDTDQVSIAIARSPEMVPIGLGYGDFRHIFRRLGADPADGVVSWENEGAPAWSWCLLARFVVLEVRKRGSAGARERGAFPLPWPSVLRT